MQLEERTRLRELAAKITQVDAKLSIPNVYILADSVLPLLDEVERLQKALRHQAQRNHNYLPSGCSACAETEEVLRGEEPAK